LGPMMGQANHFRRYAKEKIAYAVDRRTNQANRLTNILDERLGESRYVACDEYTIVDISIFRWLHGAENCGHEPRRISKREALVRPNRRTSRGAARGKSARFGAIDCASRSKSMGHCV